MLSSVHKYAMFIINERQEFMNALAHPHTRKDDLLEMAIGALKNNLPVDVRVKRTERQRPMFYANADFVIWLKIDKKQFKYFVEIKHTVTKAVRIPLMMQKERLTRLLLITRYVNPELADQLKQDGIEFVDTAGNAFIHQPAVFIFIKGNKRPELLKEAGLNPAFRPVGLRIIYVFLCRPDFVGRTYRDIATAAGVALGTVAGVMTDLKRLGFLITDEKQELRLINKKALLNQWTTAYAERLRPKLTIGHYQGNEGWWKTNRMDPQQAQWGGEVAAANITRYLKPEMITIYTKREWLYRLLLTNKLRKDPEGNVEILQKFWNFEETNRPKAVVNPILIYTDLLASGHQRNAETARIIYEEKIAPIIRED